MGASYTLVKSHGVSPSAPARIRFWQFSCIALLLLNMAVSGASPPRYKKCKFSYYVQVKRGDPSLAFFLPAVNVTRSQQLGLGIIFGLNVTAAQSSTSRLLGYARGYTLDTSYDSTYAGFETEIIVYDDGHYNGTIHFQALLDGSDPAEVAVLGGTGSFRGVRGWGTISQVLLNPPYVIYHHILHFMNNRA